MKRSAHTIIQQSTYNKRPCYSHHLPFDALNMTPPHVPSPITNAYSKEERMDCSTLDYPYSKCKTITMDDSTRSSMRHLPTYAIIPFSSQESFLKTILHSNSH